MGKIEVNVPDGECGNFKVETFTVSKADSRFTSLRPGCYVPEGTYKRLRRGHTTVMSNTPKEVHSNWQFIICAKGRVLINGLGLGMVLTEILNRDKVTEVWVIEKYEEVIKLVGPTFADDPRVKIIHADALEYKPPKGVRFDCVWHDIWDNICSDNLEDMKKLHRKYGRRTDWQQSWERSTCERAERHYRRERRFW